MTRVERPDQARIGQHQVESQGQEGVRLEFAVLNHWALGTEETILTEIGCLDQVVIWTFSSTKTQIGKASRKEAEIHLRLHLMARHLETEGLIRAGGVSTREIELLPVANRLVQQLLVA